MFIKYSVDFQFHDGAKISENEEAFIHVITDWPQYLLYLIELYHVLPESSSTYRLFN